MVLDLTAMSVLMYAPDLSALLASEGLTAHVPEMDYFPIKSKTEPLLFMPLNSPRPIVSSTC